jgi:chromosome partitioning protein
MVEGLAIFSGLDPVAVAIAIGVLAGILLLVTGVVVLLILQLSHLATEAGVLRERAESALETARLAAAERDRASRVLDDLRRMAEGRAALWTRRPANPPARFARRMAGSVPVLALVNLTGGVGRTTLAADLAAWFDAAGERVLLVDLDQHASLTALALGPDHPGRDREAPGAGRLLAGAWAEPVPLPWARSGSAILDAAAALEEEETRLLLRWLLDAEGEDVRYRLARQLLGARPQSLYDRVILDAPPRATLGLVNAVTAATHLLVPVRLEALSVEALGGVLATLDSLRPDLAWAGQDLRLVAMRAGTGEAPDGPETDALAAIEGLLAARGAPADLMLCEAPVPWIGREARRPGRPPAWLAQPGLRAGVDRVARAIAGRAPARAEAPDA